MKLKYLNDILVVLDNNIILNIPFHYPSNGRKLTFFFELTENRLTETNVDW